MGIMNLARNDDDFYKMDWTASKDPDAKRLSRGEQDHMVRLYGVTIMLDDAIRNGKYCTKSDLVDKLIMAAGLWFRYTEFRKLVVRYGWFADE